MSDAWEVGNATPCGVDGPSIPGGSTSRRCSREPTVIALHSNVLKVESEPRRRIYDTLLGEPHRAWNVSELAELLPDVSVEAVRTTAHLLIGDTLMEIMPRHRSLTFRLNDRGREALRQIRNSWSDKSDGEEAE
jgi:hypothetical protein